MILFALNRTLCLLGPSQIALVGDIIIVDNQQCTCFGSTCTDSSSTFSVLFSVASILHLICFLCFIEHTFAVYSQFFFDIQTIPFAKSPGVILTIITIKSTLILL